MSQNPANIDWNKRQLEILERTKRYDMDLQAKVILGIQANIGYEDRLREFRKQFAGEKQNASGGTSGDVRGK